MAVIAVAVLLVLFLQGRAPTGRPFDPDSASPNGYRVLRTLLENSDVGIEVRSASEVGSRYRGKGQNAAEGDVIFVPAPSFATELERSEFIAAARKGATVVYGSPGEGEPYPAIRGTDAPSRQQLADTPAEAVQPGSCDMNELSDLDEVDAAFAGFELSEQSSSGNSDRDLAGADTPPRFCYGDSSGALFKAQTAGNGRLIEMSSPYLWVNARMQPAKESGGQPLDNAVTALRLLAPTERVGGSTVTLVNPVPSTGVQLGSTKDPIQLLPTRVKLAVVQLLAAFGLYVWWRSRRLGKPMIEKMPVQIAGSDFVLAKGQLLRRKGSPDRAATRLRAEARRVLGAQLGVPPSATLEALAAVVAQRSGRDHQAVVAALADAPVTDSESLVRLAETLVAIRQEVLDVHVR